MLKAELIQVGPIYLDMHFECQVGELLALVGPSGSGKTSALRALAGLLPVTQGVIELDQTVWFDSAKNIFVPAHDRLVGIVFQNYALFPHLTALQNICLALPDKVGQEYAHNLMEDMQLVDLQNRFPSELSGGQRQRVALARAFARQPKLLLLDEAFSAVDYPTRKTLYEELIKLRERIAIPIVMVTHDLREARLLSDRMCILDQGRSLQQAPAELIVSSPRNARVAELVGLNDIYAGTFFQGPVPGQKSDPKPGRLLWGQGVDAYPLEINDKGRLPNQTEVKWVIAGEYVELMREDRGLANTIAARISKIRQLGDIATVQFIFSIAHRPRMQIDLSTRLVNDLDFQLHSDIYVRLDPRGIHIMPVYTNPMQKQAEKLRREKSLNMAAILLVAGEGARLGNIPKVLLRVSGKTLLERHLESMSALGIQTCVVVTGAYQEVITQQIQTLSKQLPKVYLVQNADSKKGQASSVRLGLEHLGLIVPEPDLVIMMLGDQPLLDVADLRQLVERFKVRTHGQFVFPQVANKRGNPVIMSGQVFREILQGPEQTVRGYMDMHPEKVDIWQTHNEHFIFDMDTPEDLILFQKKTGLVIELP